jgi:hypothetical protein
VTFRERLITTLAAVRPALEVPGVMVVGSEVPNLLEPGAAATLVVSQDVDLAVPVERHAEVKDRLRLVRGLSRAVEEPSVWLPDDHTLIEVNFVGLDRTIVDPADTYALEDPELPLLVFGPLSLLEPGVPVEVERLRVPVPRAAGLVLEKLLTDRTGEKGHRDLLVVAGLLPFLAAADLDELRRGFLRLTPELRYAVRSGLTVLSLLGERPGLPDPRPLRGQISALLDALAGEEP